VRNTDIEAVAEAVSLRRPPPPEHPEVTRIKDELGQGTLAQLVEAASFEWEGEALRARVPIEDIFYNLSEAYPASLLEAQPQLADGVLPLTFCQYREIEERLALPEYDARKALPRSFQGLTTPYYRRCQQPGMGLLRIMREREEALERADRKRKAAAAARARRLVRMRIIYPMRFVVQMNTRRRAAKRLQAAWQGMRGRRHVAAILLVRFVYQGLIPLQAQARTFLQRRRYLREKAAVAQIERWWSTLKWIWNIKGIVQKYWASRRIQNMLRAWKARNDLRLHGFKARVITLQRHARGRMARRAYHARLEAARLAEEEARLASLPPLAIFIATLKSSAAVSIRRGSLRSFESKDKALAAKTSSIKVVLSCLAIPVSLHSLTNCCLSKRKALVGNATRKVENLRKIRRNNLVVLSPVLGE